MEQQTFNLVIAVSIVLLTVLCFVFMILAIKMLKEGNALAPVNGYVIGGRIPRQRRMRQRMEGLQEELDAYRSEVDHLREVRETNFVLLRDQEVKIEQLKDLISNYKDQEKKQDSRILQLENIENERLSRMRTITYDIFQIKNRVKSIIEAAPADKTNAELINDLSAIELSSDNIIKAVSIP